MIISVAAIMISSGYAMAEEQNTQKTEVKAQTTCPVMGGAIDKKQFADHDGKRVYFCCPGCIGTFNKEPAKYIQKLEDSGVTLDKIPVEKDKATTSPDKKVGCGGCGK
jgi:YHS domain-containing protein